MHICCCGCWFSTKFVSFINNKINEQNKKKKKQKFNQKKRKKSFRFSYLFLIWKRLLSFYIHRERETRTHLIFMFIQSVNSLLIKEINLENHIERYRYNKDTNKKGIDISSKLKKTQKKKKLKWESIAVLFHVRGHDREGRELATTATIKNTMAIACTSLIWAWTARKKNSKKLSPNTANSKSCGKFRALYTLFWF